MTETIRSFVAIHLPGGVRKHLGGMQRTLARNVSGIRWVVPENIHLTLKFLGDVEQGLVPDVQKALDLAAANHGAMELSARGLGVFPGWKQPRVVWTGVSGDVLALSHLAQDLERALAPLGFEPENRRFSPHLTLGRARGKVSPDEMAEAAASVGDGASPAFRANSISLFQSRLTPGGAVYTRLYDAKLKP